MPESTPPRTRGRILYLVAALLALIALALGLWDLLVERDGSGHWFGQVLLPAVLVFLMFSLYLRAPRA